MKLSFDLMQRVSNPVLFGLKYAFTKHCRGIFFDNCKKYYEFYNFKSNIFVLDQSGIYFAVSFSLGRCKMKIPIKNYSYNIFN